MNFIFDLAGLTYHERRAAVPLMWASSDIVVGAQNASPASFDRLLDELDPATVTVVVRWGDMRLDTLLEQFRGRLNDPQGEIDHHAYLEPGPSSYPAPDDFVMHGRHIVVVLNNEVHEVHLIPRSLGTQAQGELDPVRYHRGFATVAPWSQPDDVASEQLVDVRNRNCGFYVKLERYVGSFHLASSIDA